MSSLFSDLAYAIRAFLKKPAFALTAILTLGLGIGAAAAIFSVVNAVLLRPLPYDRPDRLVHVANDMRNRNVDDFPWPPADFHDLRTTSTQFSGIAALVTGRQVFVTPGQNDVAIRTLQRVSAHERPDDEQHSLPPSPRSPRRRNDRLSILRSRLLRRTKRLDSNRPKVTDSDVRTRPAVTFLMACPNIICDPRPVDSS